jgi:putative membrane protein
MRAVSLALAVILLTAVWFGPLPDLARHSFSAHMTMHMAVVAVAAPLIALALAGTRADPVRIMPNLLSPVPASIIEFLIVWIWHVPVLHHAARHHSSALLSEQGSFLAAGVLLWMTAMGGTREQRRLRAGPGVLALLLTSMHMTLLGALFALANRPLYRHVPEPAAALSSLADQHLGGAIMLLAGGASYLAGGLWLTAVMLRPQMVSPTDARGSSV